MVSRFAIAILIFIALISWYLTLAASGLSIPSYWHKPASIMISVLSTVLLVFERWAWSWPIVRLLAHRPDLRGTWRVEIKSLWIDPETGKTVPPIRAYFCIAQTFSKLAIRQFTQESHSSSLTATIQENDGEAYTVFGIYHNDPNVSVSYRSRSHHGSLKMEFIEDSKPRMKGKYWTERMTTGELDAERVSKKKGGDFVSSARIESEAEALGALKP